MLRIHQVLQAGKYPTANVLSRELEVSPKSIYRDLEFMRERLMLPVEYHQLRGGYYYTQEVSAFPTVQITEGELFALVVAEKALQQYRGTTFEKPLLSAIRKMEQALPETISLDLGDVEQAISFRTRSEPIIDLGVFDALTKATAAREQIEVAYRKPGQTNAEKRLLDPYHLANINGEWFLFAYDHLRKDLRTFVPTRIQAVRCTGARFERKRRFSLESRLRHSFGVHSGDGNFDVVVRFTPKAADYVREKKWHESQDLSELDDGGVELRMQLSGLNEVQRWVLSWGGDAKVIGPPELDKLVKAAARRIIAGD